MIRQTGFTLIEAVLVMLILSLASVAVLGQFSQASRAWTVDEDLQVATQLVQERMEDILAARRNGGYVSVAVGTVNDTLTGSYAGYNRAVTVSSVSGTLCPVSNCKQAVVSVSRSGATLASATVLLVIY